MTSGVTEEEFSWQGYDASSAEHRTMLGFLVLDVQYSARHADELYASIESYLQGNVREVSGSGNGYEYECRPEGLYIDCLYDDPLTPVVIDYPLVLRVLKAWSHYCKSLGG